MRVPPLDVRIEGSMPLERLRSSTFRLAQSGFRRALFVYALAGSVHVGSSVALLFWFGVLAAPPTSSPLTKLACYGGVAWSWSMITMIALALFWGPDRQIRRYLALGYVAVLLAMGEVLQLAGAPTLSLSDVTLMTGAERAFLLSFVSALIGDRVSGDAVAFSPAVQPILFWGLARSPILIPVIAFNRLVRGTVGPLFITIGLMMTVVTLGSMNLFSNSPGLWLLGRIKGMLHGSVPGTVAAVAVIGLTLSAALAWLGLRWTAERYRRARTSDQLFLFDALWLSVSGFVSVYLNYDFHPFRYLLGLLPFALYRLVVGFGLKPIAVSRGGVPAARLLFLRVFGSSSRSERLFDLLAARWRYAGSIQLISAMDVARGRFEPDEFLDFINGRLGGAYIDSGRDLDDRLARLDARPDPDGRYRVNEFFCRSDTWQETVTRLMATSDLLVMDLRAFTSDRRGAIFELGTLLDEMPLSRVALLVDRTTDEPLLRRTLAELWKSVAPQSPNIAATPRIRIIDLASGYPAVVSRLMQLGDRVLLPAA